MGGALRSLRQLRSARNAIASSRLFDAALYRQTYLRLSPWRLRPLAHYLLFGERLGLRPNAFFDPVYYRQQLQAEGIFAAGSVLAHYAEHGAATSSAPSAEFCQPWYVRHNPDWVKQTGFATPLAHFLHDGLTRLRDPSPSINIQRHVMKLGPSARAAPAAAMMVEILRKAPLEGPSLTVDFSVLRARQDAFRAGLNYDVLRVRRPARPNLVFLQSRRGAAPRYLVPERGFDVLRNYYEDPGADICSESDHVLFQRGTKVTAIDAILRRDPELLLAYEHVLFLDDDVTLEVGGIMSLFEAMARHGAALAQPLLTPDSDCSWPVFKDPSYAGRIVPVNSVEVMMPAFSREALRRLAWTFGESVSGFGVDLLWGQSLAKQDTAGAILLIGDVLAKHEKSIDYSGGAFYVFLAGHGIDPKEELRTLISKHGIVPEFHALIANAKRLFQKSSW